MPERTCVVTREKAEQEALIRLVLDPAGRVLVDYRGRVPGRGAWVRPSRSCLEKLEARPGMLTRPLRCRSPQTAGLLQLARDANWKALEGALSLAARAGALVGGGEVVRAAVQSPAALALLIASDASPRTARDLASRAKELPVFTLPLDREALGQRIGKGPRAALVLTRGKPARHLLRELRRWEDLR